MTIRHLLSHILQGSGSFRWHQYKQLNRQHLNELLPAYKGALPADADARPSDRQMPHLLVCPFGSHYEGGGLVDRLRGLLSAYMIAQQTHSDFRIWWRHPFLLEDYLIPNEVDWRIEDSSVCWNLDRTALLSSEITEESARHEQRVRQFLVNEINQTPLPQVHLYGNMRLVYEEDQTHQLFHRLFRKSPALESALQAERERLNSPYVALQLRFVGMLGDFHESLAQPIDTERRTQLINRLISQIEQLHSQLPSGTQILLCTDSPSFRAEACARLDYLYAIGGDILHIDFVDSNEKDAHSDAYLKVFLDLFMMSEASHIYRMATPQMHLSGMPYLAAKIGNKPLSDILIS